MDRVSVQLSLVPRWSFSAVYPLTEISPCPKTGGDQIKWIVKAKSGGDVLVQEGSDKEAAYLYWEAMSNPESSFTSTHLLSSDVTQDRTSETDLSTAISFDPASPSLMPQLPTTALLPFKIFVSELDTILGTLSMPLRARTDFITYWLPKFWGHTYIAFRFLPQSEYERAAPLRVHPAPQVVTRIFLLFKGLGEGDVETDVAWESARERAMKIDWKRVIGIDEEGAKGESKFRVLEWGGMEVL